MKIVYLVSSTHRHRGESIGERIAGEITLIWSERFWFEQILETQWPREIYLKYMWYGPIWIESSLITEICQKTALQNVK